MFIFPYLFLALVYHIACQYRIFSLIFTLIFWFLLQICKCIKGFKLGRRAYESKEGKWFTYLVLLLHQNRFPSIIIILNYQNDKEKLVYRLKVGIISFKDVTYKRFFLSLFIHLYFAIFHLISSIWSCKSSVVHLTLRRDLKALVIVISLRKS